MDDGTLNGAFDAWTKPMSRGGEYGPRLASSDAIGTCALLVGGGFLYGYD